MKSKLRLYGEYRIELGKLRALLVSPDFTPAGDEAFLKQYARVKMAYLAACAEDAR